MKKLLLCASVAMASLSLTSCSFLIDKQYENLKPDPEFDTAAYFYDRYAFPIDKNLKAKSFFYNTWFSPVGHLGTVYAVYDMTSLELPDVEWKSEKNDSFEMHFSFSSEKVEDCIQKDALFGDYKEVNFNKEYTWYFKGYDGHSISTNVENNNNRSALYAAYFEEDKELHIYTQTAHDCNYWDYM